MPANQPPYAPIGVVELLCGAFILLICASRGVLDVASLSQGRFSAVCSCFHILFIFFYFQKLLTIRICRASYRQAGYFQTSRYELNPRLNANGSLLTETG